MDSIFKPLLPASVSTSPAEPPFELASQPLQFGYKDECENEATLNRIAEVLSSRCSPDEVTAAIFINARQGHYEPTINQLIRTLDDKHGSGTVVVNANVREILDTRDIVITTSEQGTVQMRLDIPIDLDTDRTDVINSSLDSILPIRAKNIIASLDSEILFEISKTNTLIEIFRSGDPIQKNQIIDAADDSHKTSCLDLVFAEILEKDGAVNLTGVDLSRLARQSLKPQPLNKQFCSATMQIFIQTMTDKGRHGRSDDQVTAQFLKNAFDHNYQKELNGVIKATVQQRGYAAVLISDNIKRLLAEKSIQTIQKGDGTIEMRGACSVADDDDLSEQRAEEIDQSLKMLPPELTKLVGRYDKALKICKKNESIMIDILKSTDQAAKGELIAAASHQNQITYLNKILNKIRGPDNLLDLSNVDLSGLNLSYIDLSQTKLHHAIMRDTILTHAELTGSRMHNANLDGANLGRAELIDAELTGASAIGANFNEAYLFGANLSGSKLQCATFINTSLNGVNSSGAYLGLNDLTGATNVVDFLKVARQTVDDDGMSLTFSRSHQTAEEG